MQAINKIFPAKNFGLQKWSKITEAVKPKSKEPSKDRQKSSEPPSNKKPPTVGRGAHERNV